jgi:N-acetylmuramoyl-L-alanine amidase
VFRLRRRQRQRNEKFSGGNSLWHNLVGVGAALVWLTACRTPPEPASETTSPNSTPFISYTNQLPKLPPEPVLTNAAVLSVPTLAPTPAPPTNVVNEIPPPPLPTNVVKRLSPPMTWEGWSQSAGWSKPQRLRNLPSLTYETKNGNGVLDVTVGNRTALWNGVDLELGFAPRLTNGQPFIHPLDLTKTLEPLALDPSFLSRTNKLLVIDPGHGGENFGSRSAVSDRYEKEFTLDWARRLQRILTNRGWQVQLTRTNDVDVSLAQRLAVADSLKADLFISLHFNSTDQPTGHGEQAGLETYCLTPVGMPSSLTRHYEDVPSQIYPNNSFDAENLYLAVRLHRALIESTRCRDRGVRRARFMTVLRGQNRPAVLLEGGYLTCPKEAELIGTSQYRQRLAEAVAKGLSPE